MQVFYDDRTHTYFILDGRKKIFYTSATQIISQYKQPFDKRKMAEITARKKGNTPEYWIKEWAKISKDAADYGTSVHDKYERQMIKEGAATLSGRSLKVHHQLPVDLINYDSLEEGIYPELKLWHHYYRIAGRTDKAILEKVGSSRYMHIEDYKTNKKISQESYQFPDGSYKKMLPPVNHLQDCNYNHYALQFAIYQFMAESLGFKPGYRKLIHVPDENTRVEYDIPYLRAEVQEILEHKTKLYVNHKRRS